MEDHLALLELKNTGNWDENEFDGRQQYNGALLGELANQKQKYAKKF